MDPPRATIGTNVTFHVTLDSSPTTSFTLVLDVSQNLGSILQGLAAKLDQLIATGAKLMTEQQGKDLIASVKDVKQAAADEAVRLDAALAKLGTATADPVVASAITDIQGVSANLRAFHADTIIPPVGP